MSDDTLLVQSAAETNVPLGHGIFYVNDTIVVNGNRRLQGQGVRGTHDPNPLIPGTMILPGPSFPASKPIVKVVNGTTRVEDLQIGHWQMPNFAAIGLQVGIGGGMVNHIDRVLLRNVMVTGHFGSMALLCAGAVSSRMDFCQFWQFSPNCFATQFSDCSTWTGTGIEIHSWAAAPNAAPVWSSDGSFCNQFYGGNWSRALGDSGPYVIGSGIGMHDVYLYQESP